jgi:hypothetical protein
MIKLKYGRVLFSQKIASEYLLWYDRQGKLDGHAQFVGKHVLQHFQFTGKYFKGGFIEGTE